MILTVFKSMHSIGMLSAGLLLASSLAAAQMPERTSQRQGGQSREQSEQTSNRQSPPIWYTINEAAGYRMQGGGDPLSKEGADIIVSREKSLAGGFGGTTYAIDAAPYRGKQIVLSATLAARRNAYGGLIWLRAGGSGDASVAFMNTQREPVFRGVGAQYREAYFVVPDSAIDLSFGIVMHGVGELRAKDLRLEVRAPSPPKPGDGKGQAEIDAAIRIVRNNAFHADRIDWEKVEPEFRARHAGVRDGRDAYPAIRELLSLLGDGHSHLVPSLMAQQDRFQSVEPEAVVVKALSGNIGYVGMPSYGGTEKKGARAFVKGVASKIEAIAPSARKGWIVDLRKDSGGNMYPMITALSAMLGDGELGVFQGRNDSRTPWRIDRKLQPRMHPDLRDVPVAVLIGPNTASSGEATALSFRGRPNTRFFGQPSAGLSSGNDVFHLPDGAVIALTMALMLDRDGRGDGAKLLPDEQTPESAEGRDPTLEAAIEWLAADR